jgi:site-specific recombinase XerD
MKPFGATDFLSQQELQKFFRVCLSPRDRTLLLVAYRHGLRPSEVGLLKVGDVDLLKRQILCRRLPRYASGSQPLGADEARELQTLVRGRAPSDPLFLSQKKLPISRKRLDQIMKSCGGRAGIPESKRRFGVLRTSLAAHLLRAGADLQLVEEILGYGPVSGARSRADDYKTFLGRKELAVG